MLGNWNIWQWSRNVYRIEQNISLSSSKHSFTVFLPWRRSHSDIYLPPSWSIEYESFGLDATGTISLRWFNSICRWPSPFHPCGYSACLYRGKLSWSFPWSVVRACEVKSTRTGYTDSERHTTSGIFDIFSIHPPLFSIPITIVSHRIIYFSWIT